MKKGQIFLLPVPIYSENIDHIPEETLRKTREIKHFIVERAKTARAYFKNIQHPTPIPEIHIWELPGENDFEEIERLTLSAIDTGYDVGILSEAGCPGIADPGAAIISFAHLQKIKVVPLVGPSSIILALMASGFNGQNFEFHGYLSNKKDKLAQQLKSIQKDVERTGTSHIFIEAPYRNQFVLEVMIQVLAPRTQVSMSIDINAPSEENIRLGISDWKKLDLRQFHKRPAVFVIGR